MIGFELQISDEDFIRELALLELDVASKLLLTMEQAGWEVITYLRSLTGETRPAARPGEPRRRAHPGGWADITGNLANAYRFELYAGGKLVRWTTDGPAPTLQGSIPTAPRFPLELKFINSMEYAAALEAKDGYWVITEITGAGGPVASALRKVLGRIAPEAEIQ